MEKVFETLCCDTNGLSTKAAEECLAIFGHNKDGKWVKEDASILVPGDIIRVMVVDIILADCRLLEGDPLKIDQSALTGEYHPVTKRFGDNVYHGSTCKQGEIEAVVIATGVHTFFGNVNVMRPNQNLGIDRRWIFLCMVHLCGDECGVDHHISDSAASLFKSVEPDDVVLMAARASRVENQDAIDVVVFGMLEDPKEARAGIQEIHFLPFNRKDRRTALTYIDNEGKMHRVSKGALEQILNLVHNKSEIERRVHSVIDKYAKRGLRSLAMAYQVTKPPLLHGYEIVDHFQARQHICGMTRDGVDDVPALKRADIGIVVADETDAARRASDILLSVIISVILTSRAICQRMKNCTIYAFSITVLIVAVQLDLSTTMMGYQEREDEDDLAMEGDEVHLLPHL
ncbi:unnamed protein product [Arabis nemorensis]|uniref:P-type H(+)-exporting transporter n=1 Tax=Arabis nemorensis TaxID=586526 RepID=A0A565C6Q3_9BRAS|nr:unnamed protein product [Arabis nemorensis]